MVQMGVNDFLGKRLQCLPCRNKLGKHFRAIALRFKHPLNSIELADNLVKPRSKRLGFAFGMSVSVLSFCHEYE